MTSRSKDKRDALLFNLLPGERAKIRSFQGNRDPITGAELKPFANLDHCHKTGRIRGLLNPMTNRALIDNIAVLEASIRYLTDPPAPKALGEEVFGVLGKAQRKRKMRYGPAGTVQPHPRINTEGLAVLSLRGTDVPEGPQGLPKGRRTARKVR